MKINEETKISTDIKSIGLIIFAVAISVWAYSEITTRITTLETSEKLMQQDLLEASTQKPIDQEQFMLIEHLSSQVEKLTIRVDDMMHNKVMINSINKDLEKALNDIEKLMVIVNQYQSGGVVIGLPLSLNGQENERTLKGFIWRKDEMPISVEDLFSKDDINLIFR